ncbi:hypothetical protein [Aeromonas caviae]|uniref:hypothetical protein n=1 Tax=Aeromonas caviae TaxID=648 RepID=UPI0038D149A9
MKTKILSVLGHLLGRKQEKTPPDIKDVFKGSGFLNAPEKAYRGYPTPLPPEPSIEAYLVRFLVADDSLTMLFQVMAQVGYEVSPELNTQVLNRSRDPASKKVMLFQHPSFAGTIVSFASDDLDVLEAIQQTRLEPPLPADSFPWIDPESLGSLQGDMEYWWTYFWLPFWLSLSQEKQSALELEPEWREFIEMHQPHDTHVSAG